jgi:hypothetical protein
VFSEMMKPLIHPDKCLTALVRYHNCRFRYPKQGGESPETKEVLPKILSRLRNKQFSFVFVLYADCDKSLEDKSRVGIVEAGEKRV